MELLNASVIKTLSEAEIRSHFESWVQREREAGLLDIKFALTDAGDGTVTDVMRQLLSIESMKGSALLEPFYD